MVPAHWAQAKVYAFIVAEQSNLEFIDIQLTYLQLDTWKRHEDRRTFSREDLTAFFTDLVEKYLYWTRIYLEWCGERDEALATLEFPKPSRRSFPQSKPWGWATLKKSSI